MVMSTFVTFESLEEGAYFFARGSFYVKETCELCDNEPNVPAKSRNALCFVNRVGTWSHFDPINMVRLYDAQVHGQPAEVVQLKERLPV